MNEIFDAFKARLSSPLLGYFTLSFLSINWKGTFFLLVQEGDALVRIEYFEAHTNIYSLLLWPLLTSIVFASVYPWIMFGLAWLTSKPVQLRETLHAQAEHNILSIKKNLEETRSQIIANAELELIERAKRDQQLDSIDSPDVRNKLKAELDELRAQRDAFSISNSGSKFQKHNELMSIAGTYRSRAKDPSTSSADEHLFLERARELEEQAHSILSSGDTP